MSAAAGQVQQLQRQQRLAQQLGGARHFCRCTAELLSMLWACGTGRICSAADNLRNILSSLLQMQGCR